MMTTKCPREATLRPGIAIILSTIAILLFANVAAFSQDQVSVSLTWTAPGDDGNSGTASQYDIRYSTSTIDAGNWDSATQAANEPSPQSAGTEESFTVTGLEPNTTYYFAIKTADEMDNWSPISNIAAITTEDTVPPAAITDLAATQGD